MGKITIEELLNQLQYGNDNGTSKLPNTKDTWARIGSQDSFSELGLSRSELDNFLKEWIDENPYSNI